MTVCTDLCGKKFNSWLVLSRSENTKSGKALWNCICACGTEQKVMTSHLTTGHSKSCGCTHRVGHDPVSYAKKYRKENSEKLDSYFREYYKTNKSVLNIKSRERHYKNKYGLTISQVEDLLQNQNGCCSICKLPVGFGGPTGATVDHDHATGIVRGILCQQCNIALGAVKDSVDILESAIKYLLKSNSQAAKLSA